MNNYSEAGKRVSTPWGIGTVLHHTDGYAGELDYFVVELDEALEYGETWVHVKPESMKPEAPVNASTGEGQEPSKIVFEKETCGRCGGKGRRSDNGWNVNHGGLCYKCHGAGQVLSANGYRASEAYLKLRDELLNIDFQDLADGEVFRFNGKCFAKGDVPEWFRVLPTSRVRRHDGPATRKLWREIAKRYKGATLVY